MTDIETCRCTQGCTVEYGKCHCGCGRSTTIAAQNSAERNWVKGEPIRYVRGHASRERGDTHTLTEIDERLRTATCIRCGEVTIKRDASHRSGWKCIGYVTKEHRIIEPDLEAKTGFCLACKKRVSCYVRKSSRASGGVRIFCKVAQSASDKAYKATLDPEKIKQNHKAWRDKNRETIRGEMYSRTYGLTGEEVAEMNRSQEGLCFICKNPPKEGRVLHVDHCHTSGLVRKLLCNSCNTGLGLFKENPEALRAAAAYVELHRDHPSQTAQTD